MLPSENRKLTLFYHIRSEGGNIIIMTKYQTKCVLIITFFFFKNTLDHDKKKSPFILINN